MKQQEGAFTYEVGGDRDEAPAPAVASFKLSGSIGSRRELYMDDDVHVRVADADGEVIFEAYGKVTDVDFKKHRRRGLVFVERKHKISLGVEP